MTNEARNEMAMSKVWQNKQWIFIKLLVTYLILVPTKSVVASDNIEKVGDILQIIIPATAYGTTLYLKDKEGQSQFYKSFATNLGATYALKYSTNKTRPNGGKHSFPSGHASAAFQGASFIHKRYGIKYAVPAYLGAAFVGYSRVKSNNHYTEDVIAGAAIGIASSFYFTKRYKGFSITPIANNDNYGLAISKQW